MYCNQRIAPPECWTDLRRPSEFPDYVSTCQYDQSATLTPKVAIVENILPIQRFVIQVLGFFVVTLTPKDCI